MSSTDECVKAFYETAAACSTLRVRKRRGRPPKVELAQSEPPKKRGRPPKLDKYEQLVRLLVPEKDTSAIDVHKLAMKRATAVSKIVKII